MIALDEIDTLEAQLRAAQIQMDQLAVRIFPTSGSAGVVMVAAQKALVEAIRHLHCCRERLDKAAGDPITNPGNIVAQPRLLA